MGEIIRLYNIFLLFAKVTNMGCSAIKVVDCFQVNLIGESRNYVSSTPIECFHEINLPYTLQVNFTPVFNVTSERIYSTPLPFDVFSKDFPVFSNSPEELLQYTLQIFENFYLPSRKLVNLLEMIKNNYCPTLPFHNFWHGFSVAQVLFVIGEKNSYFNKYLSIEEYSYLLLVGLGHDLSHPGINNSFLTAINHPLALKYNNNSVLENYHASVFLEIAVKSDFFVGIFPKKLFVEAILSTDMSLHKVCTEEFCDSFSNYSKKKKNSRQKFINYVMHCADLSNQTIEFPQAMVWSFKVLREFAQQAKSEKELGITITSPIQTGNNLTSIKNMQIGFIDQMILPMWTILNERILGVEDYISTLKSNKKKWEELQSIS